MTTTSKPTYDELERRLREAEAELVRARSAGKAAPGRQADDEPFRTFVDAAPVSVMAVREGRYVFANPAAARLLGYERPEQVVGLGALATVAPPCREAIRERLANVDRGRPNPPMELELLRRDGRSVWALSTSVSIRLGGGPAALIFGQDIGAQKRVEAALRESEARFRTVLERLSGGVFAHHLDGRLVLVNETACLNTGYTRAELLERTVADIDADSVPRRDRERFWLQLPEDESVTLEVTHRRKDGSTYPAEVHLNRMRLGGEPLILGIAHDITERRRAEREREAIREHLRRAQRLEAIGRLAGGIAHDFNNLLTVIMGHVELGLADLAEGDPLVECLEAIGAAGARAGEVTRQLLAFSRKQLIRLQLVDVGGLVRDCERTLARLLGERITLELRLGEPVGQVRADPGQLEQVLINLAVNARDAMPGGGRLTIATAAVELDAAACERHLDTQPGPYVALRVTDTGAGIAPEVLEQIFEPFFSTKGGPRERSGLGLATVYGIVRQHGGLIEVRSQPGEGATFEVLLPAARRTAAEAPHDERRDGAQPGGSETVLVAEDEPLVRSLVARVLLRAGYRVLEAGAGEQALEVARAHPGEIDLLLTDVIMPGMNGRELAEALRSLRPGVRVIYTSGYTENVMADSGVLGREVTFLPKPCAPWVLAAKVREVLDAPDPA